MDDFVHEAAGSRDVGIEETFLIFPDAFSTHGLRIGGRLDFSAERDVHGPLRSHYGDFRNGPRIYVVRAHFLGVHGDIGAAVGFTHDDGNLRHGRLGIGVKHLCSVADDAVMLLRGTGQEGGHIHQGDQGNVETVAEADEAGCFVGSMVVQGTAHHHRLICNDAHGISFHAGEAHHHVLRELFLHLEKAVPVHNAVDDLFHIISMSGIIRHDLRKERTGIQLPAVRSVTGKAFSGSHLLHFFFLFSVQLSSQTAHMLQHAVKAPGKGLLLRLHNDGGLLVIAGRKIVQQLTHAHQAFLFAVIGEMGYAALRGMHHGAAQLLHRSFLIDDRLHHVRSGDEHFRGVLHHENKIADGGCIAGSAGAGAKDHRDLGNHAAGLRMAQKHSRIAAQGVDSLLDSRSAAVVDADKRRFHLQRHILNSADFHGMAFSERSSDHGEILAGRIDQTSFHISISRYNAVAGYSSLIQVKVVDPGFHKGIRLHKGTLIEQQLQTFPRRQLSAVVLLLYLCLPAAEERLFPSFLQILIRLFPVHFFPPCRSVLR